MLVNDMYNQLALITGFPEYTNDTDTPETTRFLLECLNQGLKSVINNIYMQNNVRERTDTIITKEGECMYGLDGIIKQIQLVDSKGVVTRLKYLDRFDPNTLETHAVQKKPVGYVISKGYLRLHPVPDKEYTLKVTVSTTELVWANDDSSKRNINNINDAVLADDAFCDLVVTRAAGIVFTRAQNQLASVYSELFGEELREYLEQDIKTFEANRFLDRNNGHWNSRKGLLG